MRIVVNIRNNLLRMRTTVRICKTFVMYKNVMSVVRFFCGKYTKLWLRSMGLLKIERTRENPFKVLQNDFKS